MRVYPYRTTFDKIEQSVANIVESGDVVLSSHFMGGRDWVLLCRQGVQTVADMSAAELAEAISKGVQDGIRKAQVDRAKRMARAMP